MASVRRAADGKTFRSPTGEVIDEIFGAAAGGADQHSLAHITLPPGGSSADHYHPVAEESYYILKGHGKMSVRDFIKEGEAGEPREFEVGPGDAVAIKINTWHRIWNHTPDTDLAFIAVCVPAWTPQCSVFAPAKSD
jgi:mannose-6-phosphate isomerase-like protein (cupin superfamily)